MHDLGEATSWPRFTPRAVQAGFRSVYALPLRLRADTIGTLNLFGVQPDTLSANDLGVGQALVDVATIGILSERAIRRHEIIAEQLEGALHSRIVIEQAKAMIAERGHLDFEEAFQLLRRCARAHNQRLGELRATLNTLKSGDTLVIYKPDRVARSMKELLVLLEDDLHARNINLHILTGICAGLHRPDASSIADKMLFMVAEMERDLIRRRWTAPRWRSWPHLMWWGMGCGRCALGSVGPRSHCFVGAGSPAA